MRWFEKTDCWPMPETQGDLLERLREIKNVLGGSPQAALVQGNDGNFYGTTSMGGAFGAGTVFRLTPDGSFTSLLSFNISNGQQPLSSLLQAADGYFYGTTHGGGDRHRGTVFRLIVPIRPVIESISREGASVKVTWASAKEQRYQLEYCNELSAANWTPVGAPLTAIGKSTSQSDNIIEGSNRLYRVALLP